MANISGGSNTGNKVNVDANYNLNVVTPQTEEQAGFTQMSSEVDGGDVLGTRTVRAVEVSHDYRVRVGSDQPLYNLSFEGINIPQAHLQQNTASMNIGQANGFLVINNSAVSASGANANIKTYRTFPLLGSYPTYVDMWLREGNDTATNAVSEWGLGYVSGTTDPQDGIFFRRLAGGQLQAVMNFSGSENASNITVTNLSSRDGVGMYSPSETNHYLISNHNDDVEFWINDILVSRIATPSNQGGPTSTSTLPLFARVYNQAAASDGRRIEIGFIQVAGGDVVTNKPWSHQMAGAGASSYQNQPGQASGPTVLRTANVNGWPASATPKTTTAWAANTGPADPSLGGRWLSPAMSTLTTETDYPLFSYLNPSGSANNAGKTLYVTSARIGETSVVANAAVNAMTLFYCVAGGSTAASFATSDTVNTVGPRIVPAGSQTFSPLATTGTMNSGFDVNLTQAPLVVPPGTYFHVVCRPVGTVATNTLVVQGSVTITGYFE